MASNPAGSQKEGQSMVGDLWEVQALILPPSNPEKWGWYPLKNVSEPP